MTGGTFKTSLKHLRQTSEASARFLYRKKGGKWLLAWKSMKESRKVFQVVNHGRAKPFLSHVVIYLLHTPLGKERTASVFS